MKIKDISKMSNISIARYYYELCKVDNPEPLTQKCMEEILEKACRDTELNKLINQMDAILSKEIEE